MSNVKTVVIFEMTDETVLLCVFGDLTKFEGVIVNSTETGLEDELASLSFSAENAIETDEAYKLIANGALLVHCGEIY